MAEANHYRLRILGHVYRGEDVEVRNHGRQAGADPGTAGGRGSSITVARQRATEPAGPRVPQLHRQAPAAGQLAAPRLDEDPRRRWVRRRTRLPPPALVLEEPPGRVGPERAAPYPSPARQQAPDAAWLRGFEKWAVLGSDLPANCQFLPDEVCTGGCTARTCPTRP